MDATFALFPDAREGWRSVAQADEALQERSSDDARHQSLFRPMSHISSVRGWVSVGHGMDPDKMLALLRRIAWEYPALVVYRTSEENRWSHLMVGLTPPDLAIGEGA
jgi:hypothetical protein